MSAESTLRSFVVSSEPTALVFQGDWGIGKTYLWNRLVIAPHLKSRPKEKYTYVSLFGINSLDELKSAVSYASGSADSEQAYGRAKWLSPRKLWWQLLRLIPVAAAHVPAKVGGGPALARTISNLSFFALRERLICIDDVERRGAGLSLKDVLGLVSFLKEQRDCRVCLILNTGQLGNDSDEWNAQREKVFEAEITYQPTAEQSGALGLAGTEREPWHDPTKQALLDLELKNVRLVRRVVRSLTLVFGVASPETEQGRRRISRDLVMLVYAHSGSGAGAPPLEFVMRYNDYILAFESLRTGRGESPTPPEEVAWAGRLDDYEFGGMDDLRRELHNTVVTGFPRPAELRAALNKIEVDDAQKQAKQEFHEAWRLYHDFVGDNRVETLDAIQRTWPRASQFDHVSNLMGVVGMMRRDGRREIASTFIDEWLQQRGGIRIEELDLRELVTFEPITDAEFLRKREAFVSENIQQMGLAAALESMADREFNERAIASVAAVDASELAGWLETHPGPKLPPAIKHTLDLDGRADSPQWAAAASRMREALLIIAGTSDWAASRIKTKYGVDATNGRPSDHLAR